MFGYHGRNYRIQLASSTLEAIPLPQAVLRRFLGGVGLLRPVTGWAVTDDEMRTLAQRAITAKKLHNIREGWTRAEDTLPRRFLSQALRVAGCPPELPADRLKAMIAAYYETRGWSEDGSVPQRSIEALDLKDLLAEKVPA